MPKPFKPYALFRHGEGVVDESGRQWKVRDFVWMHPERTAHLVGSSLRPDGAAFIRVARTGGAGDAQISVGSSLVFTDCAGVEAKCFVRAVANDGHFQTVTASVFELSPVAALETGDENG